MKCDYTLGKIALNICNLYFWQEIENNSNVKTAEEKYFLLFFFLGRYVLVASLKSAHPLRSLLNHKQHGGVRTAPHISREISQLQTLTEDKLFKKGKTRRIYNQYSPDITVLKKNEIYLTREIPSVSR